MLENNNKTNGLIQSNEQLAWIALLFPYLERFNGDFVNEKFSLIYLVLFFF